MKPLMLCLMLTALPVAALAQSDGGVTVWKRGLPPGGITEKKDFGDHAMQIGHREVDGQAEIHLTKSDVLLIQSGAATLVTGGQAIDAKTVAPNELLGSGIRGGVNHEMTPGDVIEIPPGVPHQFLVPKGGQVTYFVVKVVRAAAPH